MSDRQQLVYDKMWEYLQKLLPYLEESQLDTLRRLFNFMQEDYTPIQKFGSAKIQYKLVKDEHPYVNANLKDYVVPDNLKDSVKRTLESFNQAKGHIEIEEIYLLMSMLSMIEEQNRLPFLEQENGEYLLKFKKNKILFYQENNDQIK